MNIELNLHHLMDMTLAILTGSPMPKPADSTDTGKGKSRPADNTGKADRATLKRKRPVQSSALKSSAVKGWCLLCPSCRREARAQEP